MRPKENITKLGHFKSGNLATKLKYSSLLTLISSKDISFLITVFGCFASESAYMWRLSTIKVLLELALMSVMAVLITIKKNCVHVDRNCNLDLSKLI